MTWVRLNVGGEIMETSLATVTKYPDSHLAKMFMSGQENRSSEDMEMADNSASSGEALGKAETYNIVYNIDCDPKCFKLILSWLRYSLMVGWQNNSFELKTFLEQREKWRSMIFY